METQTQATAAHTTECLLLTRLPTELRAQVYQHVLRFSRPLKLRQVVAGSKNTGILRANHQIYHETLPVLYEVNTVICSRNDFCHHTDADLQTPLRKDQVRHLLVRNFSQSIKCSSYSGGNNMYLAGCCEVCQPTATGFLSALAELPKLKTVVVDYHNHVAEFTYMKDVIRRNGNALDVLNKYRQLECTGVAQYRLQGNSVPARLNITFTDLAFANSWTQLTSLAREISVYGMPNEKARIQQLREDIDRELPDKLYFLHCARQSILWPTVFERISEVWKTADAAKLDGKHASAEMEILTEEIMRFLLRHSVEDVKLQMHILRAEEARMMGLMRMS